MKETNPEKEPAVCILEEDDSVRRAYERLFASAGRGVRVFGTVEGFREVCGERRAWCVVCDDFRRGMGLAELWRSLEGSGVGVWVVLVTSQEVEGFGAGGVVRGVFRHRKPVDGGELLESVASAVRGLGVGPRSHCGGGGEWDIVTPQSTNHVKEPEK